MIQRVFLLVTVLMLPPMLAAQQAPATAAPSAAPAVEFDERAAAKVLDTLRDGLEARSARRLLSAFDGSKMEGYLAFEDQIEAYFNNFEGIRVSMRILATSQENGQGIVVADFQTEGTPRGGGRIVHRQAQLRFVLEPTAKGWKIVDFDPRGFFS